MECDSVFDVDLRPRPPAHCINVNIDMLGKFRQECLIAKLSTSAAMRIHDITYERDNDVASQCPGLSGTHSYKR